MKSQRSVCMLRIRVVGNTNMKVDWLILLMLWKPAWPWGSSVKICDLIVRKRHQRNGNPHMSYFLTSLMFFCIEEMWVCDTWCDFGDPACGVTFGGVMWLRAAARIPYLISGVISKFQPIQARVYPWHGSMPEMENFSKSYRWMAQWTEVLRLQATSMAGSNL